MTVRGSGTGAGAKPPYGWRLRRARAGALLPPLMMIAPATAAAADGAALPGGFGDGLLYFLQQCLNAVQVSAFYGLLAVAYVLIYGIANRINLAFGALAMWAGYLVIIGITIIAATTRFGLALTLIGALAYAVLSTALLGYVVQRIAVRPLVRSQSLAILISTIGVAIVLEELMRIANDGRERWLEPILSTPMRLLESENFSVEITTMRLLILLACLALSAGLVAFIGRHRFGRTWRACSEDIGMAALCGVNVSATLGATFLLASAYAAASGAVIALYYGNVNFYMGLVLGVKTLLAAVIGGLTSIGGAFAGAFVLGVFESFWSAYFEGNFRDVAVFAALVLLMILRPNGLFARGTRADHARG